MTENEEEERRLRASALKNVEVILGARQRAERELIAAKDALQRRTEELQQQREWFEVTLASIGDGVIATDADARVTFLNPVAQAMTGWRDDDARAQPLSHVFRIINENTREDAESPIAKVLSTGRVVGLANHTALIARDGTEISIEDSAAPIRDSAGKVVGVVMVFHDVSRRRKVERALRANEERLRAVLAQAAVGIAVTDLAGRIQEANHKFCSILGYSLEELRDRSFLELTHPSDVAVAEANLKSLLAGVNESYTVDNRFLCTEDRVVWSSTTVTVLREEDGKASQFIAVIEDISIRKQADDLRGRLAAVIEFSDDAILTKTLDGIITTWNPGARKIFGYTAEEVIGKPVTMLIPENHLDEEPEILARLRRDERIDHYETVRRRKDGALIDVSLTVSPLKDSTGAIVGASKISRDITRQKRAEEALREQTRILELLDIAGKAISSKLDRDALLQIVVDIATELSGAKFGAFFYDTTTDQGESHRMYAVSGAPREVFEALPLPRSTPLLHPTFIGEGVVRSSDITQDSRYGTMAPYSGFPAGHLAVRSYLATAVVASSGAVLGGLLLGHPEPDIFGESAERLACGVAARAALAMENAALYEAARREIESRERAEAALRESDQRKDEFLATLAHELRNPLAPIRQATMISNSPAATEAQKRWSHEVISRQVRHMSLLLDDLLDISRITRGRLELRMETIELAHVVEAALETALPSIDAKNHAFTKDIPAQPIHFVGDSLRLAQVLANLLTNAAKYTDAGGNIRLQASADEETITIDVTDSGVGLSADALSTIFTMFSQVKATQHRSEGGLGIGLALAKGLVALHGGSIEARSPGLGLGSRFTVRIPRRVLTTTKSELQDASSSGAQAGRRVLIADDNGDAAESLAALLRIGGHEVFVVHDGMQALDAIDTMRPEVAILDIGMPGLDGYEVARLARQRPWSSDLVLVALTGWGQESDRQSALAAGFDFHFTKPVEPQHLMSLLQSDPRKL